MRYILLIKLPQDPENLNNTDGWAVTQVTPFDERATEWEEQFGELKAAGEILDFHIVTHEP